MTQGDGFTGQDLASAIMMGNQVALQWYAVTHQNDPIPAYQTPGSFVFNPTPSGGFAMSGGIGPIVLVGLLLVGAVILFK